MKRGGARFERALLLALCLRTGFRLEALAHLHGQDLPGFVRTTLE